MTDRAPIIPVPSTDPATVDGHTPAPPPPPTQEVVRVTSTLDKTQSACFVKDTGTYVTPCPSTAVQMDSYRFACSSHGARPTKLYAADVTQVWTDSHGFKHSGYAPDYVPFQLVFVPSAPNSQDGVIADWSKFGHWPAGVSKGSIASPSNPKPWAVETCRGAGEDLAGLLPYRMAGATETNMVWLYQRVGAGKPGYDAHGFWISGSNKIQMDNGTVWTRVPKVVAKLSAFLALHPTFDGCKSYPCGT